MLGNYLNLKNLNKTKKECIKTQIIIKTITKIITKTIKNLTKKKIPINNNKIFNKNNSNINHQKKDQN